MRTTALIFAEHEHLKRENALLNTQIATLAQTVTASDSMVNVYRAAVQQLEANRMATDRARDSIEMTYREQFKQQQRKNRRRTVIGTAAGVAAGVVIGIVIK
ncbi:hypothetical protein FACS189430_12010 [Bacteroidia bacterium]|nr:hypothetical protein FACS189430_12010 [Bacteroidia bacterium]